MKSRVLAVLFAVVLTAGTLAGCGSTKTSESTKTETTDEKSEDKDSSDKDTEEVKVASEKETEEAGFSDGTDGEAAETAVLDTSQELTGIHHADISIRDYGDIKVELDADTAPITVTNFVKLAQEGFYDGLTFWRIMDGFMMQGGDPKGNGTGGADETIKGEFSSNGVKNDISHVRGTISMARSSDPDSASSQFFIVQSDSTFLDGDYAAFGKVTDGMDIVDEICKNAKPTDNNGTIKADEQPVIETIKITD
ncbi:peptidylprolyl isomerase [Eubacterium ramulus]|jgi:cyclophilin family peptidyl-prolyl cis-trans isomerase/outer membrane murein-binding lipoprotein Lpp|uniref:peptidylprolyl isomerase n=1 Tax=Eubacterium ramulus TaxID=39490 RepID=UPI00300EE12B